MTPLLVALAACGASGEGGGSPSPADPVERAPIERREENPPTLRLQFPVSSQYRWRETFTQGLLKYLERSELASIVDTELREEDLNLVKCPGYRGANAEERKAFWVVFLASIAHAESSLNPYRTYRERDGTLSSGLLQIDVASANRHSKPYTGYNFSQDDLFNADLNLMAGLYVLKHHLEGGISGERPDVKGRLFTDRSYYWSVLTSKRALIIKTFYKNAQFNLPFCGGTY